MLLPLAAAPVSNLEKLAMAALICAVASILIVAAVKDWDWVFNSRKYRLWVNLIGRPACRAILGGVGAAIIVFMGVRLTLDWN